MFALVTKKDAITRLMEAEGIDVPQLAERLGTSPTTPYKWLGGNGPSWRTLRHIGDTFGYRFTRDSEGEFSGIEKVSPADIDNETSISDFPNDTLSEQDMVGDYELIARRYQLPHWEDLDERTRADIRIEFGVAEEAAERARSAAREAILRMMRNKRE